MDTKDIELTGFQAAKFIGVCPTTLHRWRKSGEGPPFARRGQRFIYTVSGMRAWMLRRELPAAKMRPTPWQRFRSWLFDRRRSHP